MPRRSARRRCGSPRARRPRRPHVAGVAKPWISTTAGPWPPTRTFESSRRRSPPASCGSRPGKGVGAACADRAPSARLAARAGRDFGGSGGRRGRNGCGHHRLLRVGDGHPGTRTFAGCRGRQSLRESLTNVLPSPRIDRQDYARRELGVREIERRVDDLGDITDPLHRRIVFRNSCVADRASAYL